MRYSPRSPLLPAALVVSLLVVIAGCFLQEEGVFSDGPLPKDTTVTVGGSVTYRAYHSCQGGCGGEPTYLWKKDGVVLMDRDPFGVSGIVGATSDRLQLSNIQMADSGIYSVMINDSLYQGFAHLAVTPAAP